MNFLIGVSALQASQYGINQVSNNLANATTEGYHRQAVGFQTRRSQYINGLFMGSGVEVGSVKRFRDGIVESAYTNTISDLSEVEQRLSLEQRVETFFLTGGGSIQNSLTGFFDEMARLSANPNEKSLRNSVVNQAVNLTQRIDEVSTGLVNLKQSVGQQLEMEVEALNQDIETLVELQNRISAAQFKGVPHSMLDQRDQLINKIAESVDIQRFENSGNGLAVGMAGSSVSIEVVAIRFETATAEDGTIRMQMEEADRETRFLGGRIAALTDAFNSLTVEYTEKLESFTKQLIQEVDQAHAVGLGLNGPFSILRGSRSAEDISLPLAEAGLSFPVEQGELFVSVISPSGERQLSSVSIDPATDSLEDVAARISDLDNIQAVVDDQTGRLSIIAAPGFKFDLTGQLESTPQLDSFSGSSVPGIAGSYQGDSNQQYIVQMIGSGEIGKTPDLKARVTDLDGNVIKELNVGEGYEAGAQIDLVDGVTVSFGAGDIADGDSFETSLVADADTSGILSALGLNSFFRGSDPTNIKVDARIVENSDEIATSRTGEIGDTRNLAEMISLRNKNSLGNGRQTFDDYLAETSAEIGFRVQSSISVHANISELNYQYKAERDSVSGVDINEELVNLTQHQKSYEAAIQVVRTMETMLDDLFQMIR